MGLRLRGKGGWGLHITGYNQVCILPISCSGISPLIFRFVMSLCEARNSTTFPFSFLIGTMSNKHQKGDPERKWTKVFLKRSNADNEFYNFPAFITFYIGKRGSCPNLIFSTI